MGGWTAASGERLEWKLCRSGPARRRLIEIAGRDRLFEDRGKGPWLPRRALIAAAAASLAGVALWYVGTRPAAPTRGELPAFAVRVEAVSTQRSPSEALIEAPLGSTVRIFVEPTENARDGVTFGLYRSEGRRLLRIGPGPGVELETERGAARFVGRARALAGDDVTAGRKTLFVVAATGPLPRNVAAVPGADSQQTLVDATGGRVYRTEFILREPLGGTQP